MSNELFVKGRIGSVAFEGTLAAAGEGEVTERVALAAAKSGSLTTRSSDTAGTLTLAADHGITDGQTIDIFWTDAAGVLQCAYGATVGTVSGTSVPFTGAAGTVLPADESTITCCVPTTITQAIAGDSTTHILAGLTGGGHLHFRDGEVSPGSIVAVTLQPAKPYFWMTGITGTNPLAGETVATILASNAAAAAYTLELGLVVDSVA